MEVENYKWYGHNRINLHKNAKKGSGGVGFLVREELLNFYNIEILDKSTEGILWISLKAKTNTEKNPVMCYACVCYLPPQDSSRNVDPNEFFDTLLGQIHVYGKDSTFFLCGDYNARCADLEDFIPGIDSIPERNVIDFVPNKYGQIFCDFLIDANCCVLNGRRNYLQNNYTYISPAGSSVVDYCVVPYETLEQFDNFSVLKMSELLNDTNYFCGIDSTTCGSDHSLLTWTFEFRASVEKIGNKNDSVKATQRKIFNRTVPENFLLSKDNEIEKVIDKLSDNIDTQSAIDKVYSEFETLLTNEIDSQLEPRMVRVLWGVDNKKRRTKKPWWSEHLSDLWNKTCNAEKEWLGCHSKDRKVCRTKFLECRKTFDRQVQRNKRQFHRDQQIQIDNLNTENPKEFWREIGKIGVGNERKKQIPSEVVTPEGLVSNNQEIVLETWKTAFCRLLNPEDNTIQTEIPPLNNITKHPTPEYLNEGISVAEITEGLVKLKNNKASGYDNIPSEIIKCPRLHIILHSLINKCFEKGIIPSAWKKGVINPVPKSSTADSRDPLSYRGITITSSIYKLYCQVLSNRLTKWETEFSVIHDQQNGFRKGRSTIDQISSLTSIIETRKLKKLSTFVAFIDFKKAYDSIDRDILFRKLSDLGIAGYMYKAIISLYDEVKCCVRINGFNTDWFDVKCGLKQGCSLSTLWFNLYINDLITHINSLGAGVEIGEEKIAIMLYADDLVLLAKDEQELQCLLGELSSWCDKNKLTINGDKSQVIHFRPKNTDCSKYKFKCGLTVLETVSKYTYLGLLLTEHLDYNITARQVAKAGNRALGLIIAKDKAFGGLPFKTFTKLYDSMVWSVINYAAGIWGCKTYSCINAVQSRAERYFLGVGRYTPNTAVHGDTAWHPPIVKQWKSVINIWCRLTNMDSERLNAKVFKWSQRLGNRHCKNWCYTVQHKLDDSNLDLNTETPNKRIIQQRLQIDMLNTFENEWRQDLDRQTSLSGSGRNKLRTYRLFKTEYKTEPYLNCVMSKAHRSAYAKFRCGVAPIRLETGRYERLEERERTCFHCKTVIENEEHVLLDCPLYNDLRLQLFEKYSEKTEHFNSLSKTDKVILILGSEAYDLIRISAKICHSILKLRRELLYKS